MGFFATWFVKWKGSSKPKKQWKLILDCQVGVPLHLVLKEGEAFVAPIFGELLLIFWNWKMGLRKKCPQKWRGYCPTFKVVVQPQVFCLRLDFTPIIQGSVIPVWRMYIFIYTYAQYIYVSLSLCIYIYMICTYYFHHADRGYQIIMPTLYNFVSKRGLLEGGGLCRGSLTWPGSLGVGHARSSRETWKALGCCVFFGEVHLPIHNTLGGRWWIIPNPNNWGGEELK